MEGPPTIERRIDGELHRCLDPSVLRTRLTRTPHAHDSDLYNPPEIDKLPECLVAPLKRWRIDNAILPACDYHFNGSLVGCRRRQLLAYRLDWYSATIRIAELRDGVPVNDAEVDIPRSRRNAMAVEDPRFFLFDGDLWLQVAALECDQSTKKAHTNIQLVRLDSETLQPVESYFPDYQPRREWEKNWGMFDYG